MDLPNGLKEEEFVRTISIVASRLANKFKFGYHSFEDMKQEAIFLALKNKVLDKWDSARPLENFLYTCLHNLLHNYKRDNYERLDKPCLCCRFYDKDCEGSVNQCLEYKDKTECALYAGWLSRNNNKKNIMKPIDIGNVNDAGEDNMRLADPTLELENTEIWNLIDQKLDISFRQDYIKLRNGVKLSKKRRQEIEQAVLEITQEHYDRED